MCMEAPLLKALLSCVGCVAVYKWMPLHNEVHAGNSLIDLHGWMHVEIQGGLSVSSVPLGWRSSPQLCVHFAHPVFSNSLVSLSHDYQTPSSGMEVAAEASLQFHLWEKMHNAAY